MKNCKQPQITNTNIILLILTSAHAHYFLAPTVQVLQTGRGLVMDSWSSFFFLNVRGWNVSLATE